MKQFAVLIAVLAAASACKKKAEDKGQPTKGSAEVAAQPIDASAAAADAAAAAWDGKSPLPITEGFSTPESVLYDSDADIYLVSNINGEPLGADDNGFIAKLSPDGKITEAKWIDGSKDNIKLD